SRISFMTTVLPSRIRRRTGTRRPPLIFVCSAPSSKSGQTSSPSIGAGIGGPAQPAPRKARRGKRYDPHDRIHRAIPPGLTKPEEKRNSSLSHDLGLADLEDAIEVLLRDGDDADPAALEKGDFGEVRLAPDGVKRDRRLERH